MPVAVWMAVTSAFTITAPDGSVTRPPSDALLMVCCAGAIDAAAKVKVRTASKYLECCKGLLQRLARA